MIILKESIFGSQYYMIETNSQEIWCCALKNKSVGVMHT